MKKVLIVGGGLAGLSLSVFLRGEFEIELIEASPKLGGRAYSFFDPLFETEIDNGQHLLMGCYKSTLDYLSLINTTEKIEIETKLNLSFVVPNGKCIKLKSFFPYYPFDLLESILTFNLFPFKDRVKIVKLLSGLLWKRKSNYEKSVFEWLKEQKQSEDVINQFWSLLVKSMMNTSVYNASAELFKTTLHEVFLKGSYNSKFIIPRVGLSELFVRPAKEKIEDCGGKIVLSERVTEINIENNRVINVITNKREIKDFDFVVFCVPPYSLKKIKNSSLILSASQIDYIYSPILSAHIRLKTNCLKDKIYSLTSSEIDWVFNHGSYISIVLSAAEKMIDVENSVIKEYVLGEIDKYLNISKNNIISIKIVKEKRATPIFNQYSNKNRPDIVTKIQNLYLGGDWVQTNLPATIESAIQSSKKISDILEQTIQ